MILTIHQPAYLPWLGYFDKIARADVFVFLETVQFEKNSFINRNQIKTAQGATWLTVPVLTKGHMQSTIQETAIDNRQAWAQKHLKSIFFNYQKAPRFEECYTKLEKLYETQHETIAALCNVQLEFWLKELEISTRVVRSSELSVDSSKSELVLDICKELGAEKYISGALGEDYLEQASFTEAGIELEIQSFQSPQYAQLYGEFIPNLSVVDYWMNVGGALPQN